MRFILLLVYILTLIPHPELATKLCISDGELVYEGIHLPQSSDQCGTDGSCDTASNHSHDHCLDVDEKPIPVSANFVFPSSPAEMPHSLESIFAIAPFRAPPAVFVDPFNLPFRIGLILKNTAVILC